MTDFPKIKIELAQANAEIAGLRKEIVRLKQQNRDLRVQLKTVKMFEAEINNLNLESERLRGIVRELRAGFKLIKIEKQ